VCGIDNGIIAKKGRFVILPGDIRLALKLSRCSLVWAMPFMATRISNSNRHCTSIIGLLDMFVLVEKFSAKY
jgi:hypothetical protein